MTRTVSARLPDEVAERLEEQPNKSATLREAVRAYLNNSDPGEDGLSDEQQRAYEWLMDYEGRNLDAAVTILAQELSMKKELLKLEVLRPLERKGMISVTPKLHHVQIELANQ